MERPRFTLIGVYDADGTVTGELRYWIGTRLGRTHCSLCEITHGLVREKAQWRVCRDEMTVDFVTFHRDDAPRDILEVAVRLPVVAARTDDGVVVVLTAEDLDGLGGDTEVFAERLAQECQRLGLGEIR